MSLVMNQYAFTLQTHRVDNHAGSLNVSAITCCVLDKHGEILCETGQFIHENDAIYAALHQLAVLNNFTGCLHM